MDPMGRMIQSSVGFFPPEEFIASLELGLAKIELKAGFLDECLKHLDCILTLHSKSASAPEAVFYRGVTEFKISGEAGALKETYNRLKKDYPDSEWVYRASPYRLL